LQRSPIRPGPLATLAGVLLLEQQGAPALALEIATRPAPASPLWLALGLAFVSGLLLNLMPCVLPVLAIKALSFARAAHGGAKAARGQALWFAAGVLASFWALAAVLLAL